MAVRPIRLFGDPVLRTPAEPVVDFDRELHTLVADLVETMHAAPGRGLAAPQIGVGLRVFTYQMPDEPPGHLVNPQLVFPDEEEQLGPEGCLSIPGLTFDTARRRHVVASGFSMHGEPVTVTGSDLLARAIAHETDHLDGVLFLDRLDPASQQAAAEQIRAAEWSGGVVPEIRTTPHPMGGVAR